MLPFLQTLIRILFLAFFLISIEVVALRNTQYEYTQRVVYKIRRIDTSICAHPLKSTIATLLLAPFFFFSFSSAQLTKADDELAKFAAEGNAVGVDGQCFLRKCAVESYNCASDPNCIKGLSCLARCKGASMCSTGCFAKFGSDRLDNLLSCTIEKHDCVHVPRPEGVSSGWALDKRVDLPSQPLASFDAKSLSGAWFKVMGLDSRYDCFDCQKNTFFLKGREDFLIKRFKDRVPTSEQHSIKSSKDDWGMNNENPQTIFMEALFRIPRPSFPGYLQNNIKEELKSVLDFASSESYVAPTFQSEGHMFGLTFWENWYVLGDSGIGMGTSSHNEEESPKNIINIAINQPPPIQMINKVVSGVGGKTRPDMKLIFYTGHTLQGSYKGAFIYSRSAEMTQEMLETARELISNAGLNPSDFCIIRNQCFSNNQYLGKRSNDSPVDSDMNKDAPNWYFGERFFQLSRVFASELADWFEDPSILSEWLVEQQQRVVFESPLAVSPFADLPQGLREKPFTTKNDANMIKDVFSINKNALKNVFTSDYDRRKRDDYYIGSWRKSSGDSNRRSKSFTAALGILASNSKEDSSALYS